MGSLVGQFEPGNTWSETSPSCGNQCQNTVRPSILAVQSVAANSRFSRELNANNTTIPLQILHTMYNQ